MTVQEAESFLKLESSWDSTDLIDAKEVFVFELKSFFLTKVPIEKLFDSRLNKILKLKETLEILEFDFDYEFEKTEIYFEESNCILKAFENYNSAKQKLKFKILNSNNPFEIHYFVSQLIKLEKKNAKLWFLDNCWDESTLVTKEFDPMEILKALKQCDSSEIKTFEDLKKKKNNPPEILISEMKRLSLLFKKY